MMKTKNTIEPSVKKNYKYCTRTILKNNEIQEQNYIGCEGKITKDIEKITKRIEKITKRIEKITSFRKKVPGSLYK